MPSTPPAVRRRSPQALSAARYAQLQRDVHLLSNDAEKLTNQAKVKAFHRLGRRITAERLEHKSGYHNAVLRDLAADTRIALRNLQYAVTFCELYPRVPNLPLSWAHYRLLIDRPDAASRAHYQARAVDEKLSVHQLARLIASDARPTPEPFSLPRPTDTSYIYKVTVHNIVDGDTLDLDIDLGFHTLRRGRFRLAAIDCPELPSAKARAARDFVYEQLSAAKTLVVKTERTQRTDLHGRYVAHLFYSDREEPIDTCFTTGTYLNAQLLDANHAERAV